jgi:enoyl-CoA hydratase/carnithine racemase
MSETLLLERRGGVALLTLNRPEAMNAIDIALAQRLDDTLKALAQDDEVRAIVLTGAGDRAFSAGFDIREMATFDQNAMVIAFVQRDPLMWRIASHPRPIIAALNGMAYGAGALIAAAADLRIGGPRTSFRVTATKYGGANATWTLPALIGIPKAKEILMTGRAVAAEEMLSLGLLNQLVRDDQVLETALTMAEAIAVNPAKGVTWVKSLINGSIGRTLEDGFRAENVAMSGDLKPEAGAVAFAEFLKKKQS